ncbi:hypothetical protein Rt10032_c10g4152 [Rhodotorula toruloides]|uniref:Uncharacterized protein n=1 Tax=Rhodotorula toruloides TaxID=5286 RepID=A0A511KJP2_RHOTO|nr:hypothetical protein Rt10032_c10g4152 [Rhodotorula toruloides]
MDDPSETAFCFPGGAPNPPSASSDTTPSPLSPPSSLYLEVFSDDWDKISLSSAQSDVGRDASMRDAPEVVDDFLYLESDDGSKATDGSGHTTPSLHSDTTSRATSPDLIFQDEESPLRPSSPYLTEEEIRLDLGLLSKADYDLFTTPCPVEPSWHPEILEGMLRLFKDCAKETHCGG